MYYLVVKVSSATTLEIWEKLISGPTEEVTMKWAKDWKSPMKFVPSLTFLTVSSKINQSRQPLKEGCLYFCEAGRDVRVCPRLAAGR